MALKDVLYKVSITRLVGNTGVEIEAITFDSRAVKAGSLFVAIKGLLSDGHLFIPQAVENGALAVICEELPENPDPLVTWVQVKDSHEAIGIVAANFYNEPSRSIKLIGVTGTNGKTTCVTLLFKLFTELGFTCGLISTIENRIGNNVLETRFTTPDAVTLNALLRQMVDGGAEYCFMEVSSHAIAQRRISGLSFTGGIFTNITHDHLDFHKTFAAYIAAKKMFFDGLERHAFALVNADDRNGIVMLQNTSAHRKTYALKTIADFKGRLMENHFKGMLLNVDGIDVWFKLVGSFNAYNILAVYATAMLLDQDKMRVLTILSRLSGAEGRFEYVESSTGIIAIVDYAHTPDAVKNVLETIRDVRRQGEKIITVIGCGGDRDKSKRPEMARAASDLSDKVILTSDNPRNEDPAQIIRDMEAALTLQDRAKVLSIEDRRAAIKAACHIARTGDIILLAGKGHEKYQEIAGVRYPFDDKLELFNELKNLGH